MERRHLHFKAQNAVPERRGEWEKAAKNAWRCIGLAWDSQKGEPLHVQSQSQSQAQSQSQLETDASGGQTKVLAAVKSAAFKLKLQAKQTGWGTKSWDSKFSRHGNWEPGFIWLRLALHWKYKWKAKRMPKLCLNNKFVAAARKMRGGCSWLPRSWSWSLLNLLCGQLAVVLLATCISFHLRATFLQFANLLLTVRRIA